MKFTNLIIRYSEFSVNHIQILEAETLNEIKEILSQPFPSYIKGMICFPLHDNIEISTDDLESANNQTSDWIGINLHGHIYRICKKQKPNTTIKFDNKIISIMVLQPGMADQMNLEIDNVIIHNKFNFSNT